MLKTELKSLGKDITELKSEIKTHQRADKYAGSLQNKLRYLKHDFRHKHIAYCLMRGVHLELIETPRADNKPNLDLVRSIMDEHSKKTKLYVFVRQDISFAQQAVQAGHAIAMAVVLEPREDWKPENGTVILLAVKNGEKLMKAKYLIDKDSRRDGYQFFEPDMDDAPTAIACFAPSGYFWTYDLARFKNKCCTFLERFGL